MDTYCLYSRQLFALLLPTEWELQSDTSFEFELEPGDIVRGCRGLVWATVHGEHQDIMLSPGDTYVVPHQQRMYFSGFGASRMVILTREPFKLRTPRSGWGGAVSSWSAALVERWLLGGRVLSA